MSDFILAIDLGTTSCKSALFDAELREIGSFSCGYPTLFPHEGWAEQPAPQWWEAVVKSVANLLESTRVAPSRIACIGIDSMGSVVLPVDGAGIPLRNGLIWMDRRSERQCAWIGREMESLLWSVNGNRNDPSNIAPKILWIQENEPEIYKRTQMFLHANGYLVHRLTGVLSIDVSEGGLTQLFNTRESRWSDELITACGIDRKKLPEVFQCHEIVGRVTAEAARETGLISGIPVVAGSMDCVASALGSGVCEEGDIYTSAGTVTATGVCLNEALSHPQLHIYSHIIPHRYLTVAGVDFGGAGLKWFKELIDEKDFREFDRLSSAARVPRQPLIFIPYMVGQRAPIWDSTTRGAIVGLHPSTSKEELIRMFMEGNALGTRNILSLVENLGVRLSGMRLTGGCSRSEPWSQIFSDVTGKEIPGNMDVTVLGSAMTAATGVGMFSGFSDAIARLSTDRIYKPNAHMHSYYTELFPVYMNFFSHLRETYLGLDSIRKKFSEGKE
jgi:xylulokinase